MESSSSATNGPENPEKLNTVTTSSEKPPEGSTEAAPVDTKQNGEQQSSAASNHPLAENEHFQKLKQSLLPDDICEELVGMVESGMLEADDLEERVIGKMKRHQPSHILAALKQFKTYDFTGMENKSAFINSMLSVLKDRIEQGEPTDVIFSRPLLRFPDSQKFKELIEKYNAVVEVNVGQRKFGPPKNWTEEPPVNSEVYVGRVPKELFETDLIPLFEQCGSVYDVRLMMEPGTSYNKGYAFITFSKKEEAHEAQKKFDGYAISEGKHLKCNISVANTRLFIGNLPKTKSKEDILEEFKEFAENIMDVIVFANPDDPERFKNRGFGFVQFSDHKSASNAKKKLSTGRYRPWGREVQVDWAEMQEEEEVSTDNVKILYVRNLKQDATEELLKEEFSKHGEVEEVTRIKDRDYGFVHFKERECALKAMEALQGHEFCGAACEISLAKPKADPGRRQQLRRDRERRRFGQHPSSRGYGYSRGPRGGGGGFFRGPAGARGGGYYGSGPRGGSRGGGSYDGYAEEYGPGTYAGSDFSQGNWSQPGYGEQQGGYDYYGGYDPSFYGDSYDYYSGQSGGWGPPGGYFGGYPGGGYRPYGGGPYRGRGGRGGFGSSRGGGGGMRGKRGSRGARGGPKRKQDTDVEMPDAKKAAMDSGAASTGPSQEASTGSASMAGKQEPADFTADALDGNF